eukprot:TRINITY_DN889_c0_g1_i3.p1 TRINITY_DN889_c0_g1~~TRINITY_DN889_c0_g1_i3.p1  ORF type:complete len:383 (+),score=132.54 TRINITY_DN889_c0_g1_i3:121-1269(+)
MNILKNLSEALLGRDDQSFEEKKERFEKLEKSENKELVITEPIEKEIIIKPEVIENVIKPSEEIVIQPIVNLEREQTELHEVIQPITQKEILPTTVEQKELPTIRRDEVHESSDKFTADYAEMASSLRSTTRVEKTKRNTVQNKPIVKETIHKKVIEEIQPVIHKETIAPHLIKSTQPIYEKIVEAPTLVREDFAKKTDLSKLEKEGVKVESFTKKPIIEETIKPALKVEVQPVINLEREQTEFHEVIQPMTEKNVLPTTVEEKQLPSIEKEEVRESDESFKKEYQNMTSNLKSTLHVEKLQKKTVTNAPIVRETIHKKIIEEVQPVLHKETIVPHIIKENVTIHEKYVEAPVLIKEVLPVKDLGTVVFEAEATIPESKNVA